MKETDHTGSRSTEILTLIEESRAENATDVQTSQGAATAAPRNEWGERLTRYQGQREQTCPACDHPESDLWISEGAVDHAFRCRACCSVFVREDI